MNHAQGAADSAVDDAADELMLRAQPMTPAHGERKLGDGGARGEGDGGGDGGARRPPIRGVGPFTGDDDVDWLLAPRYSGPRYSGPMKDELPPQLQPRLRGAARARAAAAGAARGGTGPAVAKEWKPGVSTGAGLSRLRQYRALRSRAPPRPSDPHRVHAKREARRVVTPTRTPATHRRRRPASASAAVPTALSAAASSAARPTSATGLRAEENRRRYPFNTSTGHGERAAPPKEDGRPARPRSAMVRMVEEKGATPPVRAARRPQSAHPRTDARGDVAAETTESGRPRSRAGERLQSATTHDADDDADAGVNVVEGRRRYGGAAAGERREVQHKRRKTGGGVPRARPQSAFARSRARRSPSPSASTAARAGESSARLLHLMPEAFAGRGQRGEGRAALHDAILADWRAWREEELADEARGGFASDVIRAELMLRRADVFSASVERPNPLSVAIAMATLDGVVGKFGRYAPLVRLLRARIVEAVYAEPLPPSLQRHHKGDAGGDGDGRGDGDGGRMDFDDRVEAYMATRTAHERARALKERADVLTTMVESMQSNADSSVAATANSMKGRFRAVNNLQRLVYSSKNSRQMASLQETVKSLEAQLVSVDGALDDPEVIIDRASKLDAHHTTALLVAVGEKLHEFLPHALGSMGEAAVTATLERVLRVELTMSPLNRYRVIRAALLGQEANPCVPRAATAAASA